MLKKPTKKPPPPYGRGLIKLLTYYLYPLDFEIFKLSLCADISIKHNDTISYLFRTRLKNLKIFLSDHSKGFQLRANSLVCGTINIYYL